MNRTFPTWYSHSAMKQNGCTRCITSLSGVEHIETSYEEGKFCVRCPSCSETNWYNIIEGHEKELLMELEAILDIIETIQEKTKESISDIRAGVLSYDVEKIDVEHTQKIRRTLGKVIPLRLIMKGN